MIFSSSSIDNVVSDECLLSFVSLLVVYAFCNEFNIGSNFHLPFTLLMVSFSQFSFVGKRIMLPS